jgi:hypothetical protein
MTFDDLKRVVKQRPFEPFRVKLDSGETVEASDPENVFLSQGGIVVFYRSTPELEFPDRFMICRLAHIVAIDMAVPG